MSSQDTPAFAPTTGTPLEVLYRDLMGEMASTRRMLARVPDGHTDWRPHEKSMPLGRLASHVAELPGFAMTVLTSDELDFAKGTYVPNTLSTTEEILALFDSKLAGMKEALENATWDSLNEYWTLRVGDHVIVRDRKGALLRTVGVNHIIHHRAQLSVYLRLLNVPVPGMYGPTADEM